MNSKIPEDRHEQAQDLFQRAYRAQMTGDLDRAAELYKASLEILPSAEAHTFLGWTYHFQGKIQDAIDECKRAIAVDPDFGNPYNDIGAYLIALGKLDEAVPWLERALHAPRYDPRHFPHFNLGRVYLAKGMFNRARQCFQEALRIEPNYTLARQAIENLRRMVN
ncbi:MAG TPA: tetratricopeptide repeat protein [Candidatus Baltobacteraceae bacterium]|jgi:Tfp pilus assembly protein PilF|nr:tetratricopeptide repeat protein [Candidatus Baltobacteraceae bacterium]